MNDAIEPVLVGGRGGQGYRGGYHTERILCMMSLFWTRQDLTLLIIILMALPQTMGSLTETVAAAGVEEKDQLETEGATGESFGDLGAPRQRRWNEFGLPMMSSLAGSNVTIDERGPAPGLLETVNLLVGIPSCWKSRERRSVLRRLLPLLLDKLPRGSVAYRFLMSNPGALWADPEAARGGVEGIAAQAFAELAEGFVDLELLGPYDCNPQSLVVPNQAFVFQKNPAATTWKSRHFFRWAIERFRFRYLVKADDDAYLRIEGLHRLSLNLPIRMVYFGYMVAPDPTQDEALVDYHQSAFPVAFALGMCWGVSFDVAKLLAETTLPLKTRGSEDMSVGLWMSLLEGLKYVHIPGELFHDHPEAFSPFNRSCSPESLVVHRMAGRWDQSLDWRDGSLLC